jgi:hypothetical protein
LVVGVLLSGKKFGLWVRGLGKYWESTRMTTTDCRVLRCMVLEELSTKEACSCGTELGYRPDPDMAEKNCKNIVR